MLILHMQREMLLQGRQLSLLIYSALFFIMVAVFFPLTMPPDINHMRSIAPGLIWIAVLLSMLLAADRLFGMDEREGVLDFWLSSGISLWPIVMAKLIVHGLLTLLPFLLFCPLLAILFSLSAYELGIMMLALICGLPALLCLCALAAAFSLGIRQKGVLMALILLPLTVPVMIFGSAALAAAMHDLSPWGHLAFLAALSIIAFLALPAAISAVIRVGL